MMNAATDVTDEDGFQTVQSRRHRKQTTGTKILSSRKPRLVIFDLDFTLWPFWLDTHVSPPFRKESNLPNGKILDSAGTHVKVFPEASAVLEQLHKEGILMGLASRTTEIEPGKQLVKLLGWEKYFPFREIYPGSKITHFNRHQANSQIAYKDMLFFDDEERNIENVSSLGVTCILANRGISLKLLEEGLELFSRNHAK